MGGWIGTIVGHIEGQMFMTLFTRGLLEPHVHDYFDVEKAKK